MALGLARVRGPSMVPALHDGDVGLVRYGARVRPGDVVVVRHPRRAELLLIKRAVRRERDGWWVEGDNPFVADDSRAFGVVPDELVLARWLGGWPPRRVRSRRR